MKSVPLADIVAGHPHLKIIEDRRERYGFVLVKCPHDDGTDDHALYVCNPLDGLPAHAFCLSENCKDVTTEEFMAVLNISWHLN